MAKFAVGGQHTLGISVPTLRQLAKEIGTDHNLAQELWASGIHEARLLATMIDIPNQVTEQQMDAWVKDFDSWDVCDQCCLNLFRKTPFAYDKVEEWSRREEEFVKRAGFALMATLAVHDKKAGDDTFIAFLPIIKREATDERNFVKKAVNWALRQIGKRNLSLNQFAIHAVQEIQQLDSKSARWIAADALRELTSEKVQLKLRKKKTNA
jgi:3-methyladenine DNA glycosylase AlkD